MKISRTTAAAAGLSGLLVVGALLPAVAQEDTATQESSEATESPGTEDSATDASTDDGDDTGHGDRGPDVEALAEALAAELDLDVEAVEDALDAVRDDMVAQRQVQVEERRQAWLDERVETGDLTEEEAAALLEQDGPVPGMGRGHRGHGRGHGPDAAPDDAGAPTDEATPSSTTGASSEAVDA